MVVFWKAALNFFIYCAHSEQDFLEFEKLNVYWFFCAHDIHG